MRIKKLYETNILSVISLVLDDTPQFDYLFWDQLGGLLYIGISLKKPDKHLIF